MHLLHATYTHILLHASSSISPTWEVTHAETANIKYLLEIIIKYLQQNEYMLYLPMDETIHTHLITLMLTPPHGHQLSNRIMRAVIKNKQLYS